jgi:predicted amidohydrolase
MTRSRRSVRIAAAQTPEFLEDVDGALACLAELAQQAADDGAKLLCCCEGFLQGYLTDEPSARRAAIDLASPAFEALLQRLPSEPMIVFGLIEIDRGQLYNTAVVVHRHTLVGRYRKTHLLGRERCFQPGAQTDVFEVDGLRFGINICYDTNFPAAAKAVADLGASLLLCPANNMMPRETAEVWKEKHNPIRGERCRETGLWLMSADVTGERDGRVSWGPTAVLTPTGEVAAQLPISEPGLLVFDLPAER